ncbi:MAG: hypothetical protein EOO03_14830 [Chitinophagaceae bacterium]|nr:MAG: hypothetical protein EOO03_14830 [Chitinophagaceae bacterium]
MKYIKKLLLVCLLLNAYNLMAQTKPATPYKVPKLYTQLGSFRDSVSISVAEAENAVGQTLKIFDDKKGVYTVSSYQFLYRKRGVTEDEVSGKVSPTTTIVAQRFKTTPLPQIWIESVRQEVKSGEELYFFDVIAKDAQGRVMYAPDFKIKVL